MINTLPDALLFFSIISEYLLDRYFAIIRIIPVPINYLGLILIIVGVGLGGFTLNMLKVKKTSTNASDIPSVFITSGPFSVSRNPFYLSYMIILVGVAVLLGSLSSFIPVIISFLVLNFFVIPMEERILGESFVGTYGQYKRRVYRWFGRRDL